MSVHNSYVPWKVALSLLTSNPHVDSSHFNESGVCACGVFFCSVSSENDLPVSIQVFTCRSHLLHLRAHAYLEELIHIMTDGAEWLQRPCVGVGYRVTLKNAWPAVRESRVRRGEQNKGQDPKGWKGASLLRTSPDNSHSLPETFTPHTTLLCKIHWHTIKVE